MLRCTIYVAVQQIDRMLLIYNGMIYIGLIYSKATDLPWNPYAGPVYSTLAYINTI